MPTMDREQEEEEEEEKEDEDEGKEEKEGEPYLMRLGQHLLIMWSTTVWPWERLDSQLESIYSDVHNSNLQKWEQVCNYLMTILALQ